MPVHRGRRHERQGAISSALVDRAEERVALGSSDRGRGQYSKRLRRRAPEKILQFNRRYRDRD